MNYTLKLAPLAIAAAVALAACGKKEEPVKAEPAKAPAPVAAAPVVIKIGHVAPLTGGIAHLGKDNENGARLAVDEINAAGGLKIGDKSFNLELVPEDDKADPKEGTLAAQKLVDAGVVAVVGHLNSGTTIPASKIYSDASIAQISPSATNPKYTEQGFKTTFRVVANDNQQGAVLANYAAAEMKAKTIAIIDDRTAYGQGLADEFEKAAKAAGGAVVAREFTNDKATDFTAILTSIKGKAPDLLFFGGMDPQGGPMAKQMKSLGLTARLLGGDGLQNVNFVKLAAADAEGVVASSPGLPIDSMPGGPEFRKRFEAKYGVIQVYAPYAYDAVYALVDAMKRAGSADPAKVLAELPKTDLQGVSGPVKFDAKGDTTGGAVTLYEVKGGAWQVLETVK